MTYEELVEQVMARIIPGARTQDIAASIVALVLERAEHLVLEQAIWNYRSEREAWGEDYASRIIEAANDIRALAGKGKLDYDSVFDLLRQSRGQDAPPPAAVSKLEQKP